MILGASIQPIISDAISPEGLVRRSQPYSDFNDEDSIHELYARKGYSGGGGGRGGGKGGGGNRGGGGGGGLVVTFNLVCGLSFWAIHRTIIWWSVPAWCCFIFVAAVNRVWAARGEPKKNSSVNEKAMQPAFTAQFVGDMLMILSLAVLIIICVRIRNHERKKDRINLTPWFEASTGAPEMQKVAATGPATHDFELFSNEKSAKAATSLPVPGASHKVWKGREKPMYRPCNTLNFSSR
ncbi:hypothetical protein BDZ91DRAFT_804924 [Kalaharituber pfeilii]|nr:hypothetical protein BDZ91DRAFT_804924 [Kalaharituber pfeilii]